MGCDIHSKAEISWGNDEWEVVDKALWTYPYFRIGERVSYFNTPYTDAPFVDRNYDLFALLADVRNTYGIEPFSEPRGVPADASKEWLAYVEEWGADLHSMSWITAREALELADRVEKETITYSGVITLDQYLDLQAEGTVPETWSQWTIGGGVVVDLPENVSSSTTHVKTSWESPFPAWTVKALRDAVEPFGTITHDRIRFVFGFDN